MAKKEKLPFDFNEHDRLMDEAFRREHERKANLLVRLAAFDKLVDLALDGVITMDEALSEYRQGYVENEVT